MFSQWSYKLNQAIENVIKYTYIHLFYIQLHIHIYIRIYCKLTGLKNEDNPSNFSNGRQHYQQYFKSKTRVAQNMEKKYTCGKVAKIEIYFL